MGILRKIRKSNIKITKKRIVLLIFTLIMATFAWIAYYKILSPTFQMHINAWNISIFVDENQNGVAEPAEERDKTSAIEVNFLEMYPDMNQEKVDIIIQNNGDTPAIFTYELSDVAFLGESYTVVDDAEQSRLENPDGKFIQRGTSTEAAGIMTYELINEPETFPFKFTVENCDSIAGGAEGAITVKALWADVSDDITEDEKNELDSQWGYGVAEFIKNNPTIAPFQFNIKINAIGLDESDRFAFTKKITPENYGDFVDYPIDLNGDGDTTNDWKIFYEDNKNIFIIAAGYAPNSMVSEEIMTRSTGEFANYCVYMPDNKLINSSIDQAIINKYMLRSAVATSNSNYKKTANLMATTYWENFVDSTLADSAVGAPTIEMFVKSWNQKFINDEDYFELKTTWVIEEEGYIVNEEGWTLQIPRFENAELYFPYTTSDNIDGTEQGDVLGYWVASPSQFGKAYVYRITPCYREIAVFRDENHNYAVRPVVCLNEHVKAELRVVYETEPEDENVVAIEEGGEVTNEVENVVESEPQIKYRIWELSR